MPGPRAALAPALVAAALAVLAVPAGAAAQVRADRGAFVVTLGRDTVAVERFAFAPGKLEGDLVVRMPRTRRFRYVATLDKEGRVTRFTTESPALAGRPASTSEFTFGTDSVRQRIVTGDSTRTVAQPASPAAQPFLPPSYALYQLAIGRLLRGRADSTRVDLVYLGAPEPFPTAITRRGPDSVAIDFFGSPIRVRVDRAGRVLGADGRGTTLKVEVKRVDAVDTEGLAAAYAAKDVAGTGLGQLSVRDTLRASVRQAQVTIDYGRPSARGRRIFGGVVPYGEVWRTGANAATGFTTSADLTIGGTAVPAGSYTLWTLPTATGAELIVNRQTGQWGTEYDPARDLARIPMERRTLSTPVERFEIGVEENALVMRWETTEWRVRVE